MGDVGRRPAFCGNDGAEFNAASVGAATTGIAKVFGNSRSYKEKLNTPGQERKGRKEDVRGRHQGKGSVDTRRAPLP